MQGKSKRSQTVLWRYRAHLPSVALAEQVLTVYVLHACQDQREHLQRRAAHPSNRCRPQAPGDGDWQDALVAGCFADEVHTIDLFVIVDTNVRVQFLAQTNARDRQLMRCMRCVLGCMQHAWYRQAWWTSLSSGWLARLISSVDLGLPCIARLSICNGYAYDASRRRTNEQPYNWSGSAKGLAAAKQLQALL